MVKPCQFQFVWVKSGKTAMLKIKMVCFVSPSTIWKTPGSGGPAEQKAALPGCGGTHLVGFRLSLYDFLTNSNPHSLGHNLYIYGPYGPYGHTKKTRMNWNCPPRKQWLIIISPLFDGHKLYYYCGKAHVHTNPWLSWAPAILSPGRAIFGSTRGWQAACCHSFLPGKLTRNWS